MTPLIFSYRQLRVLLSQRDENGMVLENFITEFTAVTGKLEPRTANVKLERNTDSNGVKRCRFRVFFNLSYHWHQARKVLAATRRDYPIRIFGIDPKRLDLIKGDLPPQIASHLSKATPRLKEWASLSDDCEVLVFDPKLDLDYRSVSNLTDAPILSPFAIIFLAFQSPISLLAWPKAFLAGWKHLGPSYPLLRRRIVSIFLLSLFLVGVQVLSKRALGKLALLSLTSNSVFIEALRARILAEPAGEVDEVQHGIASPQFDPYFLSYSTALKSGAHGKFWIHPLLAPPFCLDPSSSSHFFISETPSNTGVYRALVKVMSDMGSRPSAPIGVEDIPALSQSIAKCAHEFADRGKLIFAIFGGTDLGENFYKSSAFRAEMALAQLIYDRLRVNADIQPVYLPHPTNPKLSSITMPDGAPLQIFDQSQQMYFCADYAFSLYSSAIFEARAMGANAFCAMTTQTGILHESMLDALTCPKETTEKAIQLAISKLATLPTASNKDLSVKIEERLKVFLEGSVGA